MAKQNGGRAIEVEGEGLNRYSGPIKGRRPVDWIDATKQLPPPSDPLNVHRVLIHIPLFDFGQDDGIRFGYFLEAFGEWRVEGYATRIEVDFWMPLPDRPALVGKGAKGKD